MSLPADQWERWEPALSVRVVRQVKSCKELLCDQIYLLMAGRFLPRRNWFTVQKQPRYSNNAYSEAWTAENLRMEI